MTDAPAGCGTKRELRAAMRERAAAFLAGGSAQAESVRILAAAEALPAFGTADCILLYMALPDEVQTAPLLERWTGRKRLVIPRVRGAELELCEYDPAQLRSGYHGIPEPGPDAAPVRPEEIGLALIPGLAFAFGTGPDTAPAAAPGAAQVWRLGRGKGFYDRLLPHLRCPAVGICYPFRVLDTIPTDPWDRPLDLLLY